MTPSGRPLTERGRVGLTRSAESGAPELVRVEVDGFTTAARVLAVPRPRAVLIALHGGAVRSSYFDPPGHPDLSLLRTAAALGCTAIAIDRPGYGDSDPLRGETLLAPERLDIVFAAMEALLVGRERGAGVFLAAHSIGCELAVRMAGDPRGADLIGLEIAGTGRVHHPVAAALIEEAGFTGQARKPMSMLRLIWEPSEYYPDGLRGGAAVASRTPRYEGAAVTYWENGGLAEQAARVRIPVQVSLGDHESVWSTGSEALADLAGLFPNAPRVSLHEQYRGGHNLSLGHGARAYHLRVMAFLEECLVTSHESPLPTDDRVDGRRTVRSEE